MILIILLLDEAAYLDQMQNQKLNRMIDAQDASALWDSASDRIAFWAIIVVY